MVVDGVELGASLPSQSPGPRKGAGIAYDRNLGRIIVFGGQNQEVPVGDTWELLP